VVIAGADAAPAPASQLTKRKAAATQGDALPGEPAGGGLPQAGSSPAADALVRYAFSFVGAPYVWAGASPSGFDCSGFTQYVFKQLGVAIPRTADAQFAAGLPVSDPLPGDLVFFQTYDWGASHVGIYLGSGYFLNAIQTDVHVSSFASEYFRGRYLGARRFLSS
jgi:cell wall-associated NlpC family hydrolase